MWLCGAVKHYIACPTRQQWLNYWCEFGIESVWRPVADLLDYIIILLFRFSTASGVEITHSHLLKVYVFACILKCFCEPFCIQK